MDFLICKRCKHMAINSFLASPHYSNFSHTDFFFLLQSLNRPCSIWPSSLYTCVLSAHPSRHTQTIHTHTHTHTCVHTCTDIMHPTFIFPTNSYSLFSTLTSNALGYLLVPTTLTVFRYPTLSFYIALCPIIIAPIKLNCKCLGIYLLLK